MADEAKETASPAATNADKPEPAPEPVPATGAPPDASSAAPIDVSGIVKTVTEQVMTSLRTQLDELAGNQKVLADTMAAAHPVPGPEEIAKLVQAQLDAATKQQAAAAAAQTARETKVAELVKTRLAGLDELAALITATDDAGIEAQVAALSAAAKKLKPDFGAAASSPPAAPGEDKSFRSLLR